MSDLHLEHMSDYGDKFIKSLSPDGDEVLVLAGDIFSCAPRLQWATTEVIEALCKKYKHIVYVPGNHEFYGTHRLEVKMYLELLQRQFDPFVVLSTGQPQRVEGHRFLGDTMWVPYHPSNHHYEHYLSDFRMIEACRDFIYNENARFREYIRTYCEAGDIVVTHHLPAEGSVATEYKGDKLNRFFVSHMEELIGQKKPSLWLHGHTHHQFDYKLHDTRIVCNARGYPNEPTQKTWNPKMIIEVPDVTPS
jgi:predicted phosphodiesterase